MFNTAFLTELDQLLAKHSVARTIQRGKIVLTDTGTVESEGRTMLRIYGHMYGLTEHDYGTVFSFKGTRYKLVGLKPNRPKYPLDCEHMGDGRVFKFHKEVVPQIVALRGAAPATPPAPPAPRSSITLPGLTKPTNQFADLAQF